MEMCLAYSPGVVFSLERQDVPPTAISPNCRRGAAAEIFGLGETVTTFYSSMARLVRRESEFGSSSLGRRTGRWQLARSQNVHEPK